MKMQSILAALLLAAAVVLTGPMALAQTYDYSVLYSFNGQSNGDGNRPTGRLVMDQDGNLYGTTLLGGAYDLGVVFKLDANGVGTVLHSFSGVDGSGPYAGLILDAAGNLYGTTWYGGSSGWGTVYRLNTSGANFTVLHHFSSTDGNGYSPRGSLVLDTAGNLYGTTFAGGYWGRGTVYSLNTSGGDFTVLHSFAGATADGVGPQAAPLLDTAGNLYGTTWAGGAYNGGTVFQLSAAGVETVLHHFTAAEGVEPYSDLVMDAAGNLYGTTYTGGAYGQGTVFKLDTSGTLTVLHNFQGSDGAGPKAGLALDAAGTLYGTTTSGTTSHAGVVFKLDTSGANYTVLHAFQGGSDGANATGALLLDAAGTLYGTTAFGGASGIGMGTVFKLAPADQYSALVQQPINPDGTSVFKAKRGVVPVKFTLTLNGVQTCALPPATISVERLSNGSATDIDESVYTMAADAGLHFRIDQAACQYIYNLATSALGAGTYRVNILINGRAVGSATFGLQ